MDILHTTSQSDLGVFALGLILTGAVGGLAAGVPGVGGGIVVVPVLYHVMAALGIAAGVRMHVAIATSLAAIIPATLAHVQNSRASIDWRLLPRLIVPLLAGIALGCTVATMVDGKVLAGIFALAAFPIGAHLALVGGNDVRRPHSGKMTELALWAVAGFVPPLTGIGPNTIRRSVSGVLKIEGGNDRRLTAVLTLVVAALSAFAFAIAGWNAPNLPPDSLGYVNLLGFALIAPVLLATEPAGAALAHLMDLRRLRLVFAGLVVITTARMLWDAFG